MDEYQARMLEIAADWADRFGELSEGERREFAAWIAQSDSHAQAFARMRRLTSDPALREALERDDGFAGSPPLPELPIAARRRGVPLARRGAPVLARRQAIAAGLGAALALPLAGYGLWRRQEEAPEPTSQPRFASGIGKRRRLVLPDGTGLLLDASSAVTLHFTPERRTVALKQGAARFDVRHDAARPFEVRTPFATMMALGTSFSVDHLSSASELRVFSGTVRLDARSGQRLVVPAREWVLASGPSVRTGAFDPAARDDWQNDWLDAESMRLGFAVERLGRYSAAPLRLEDPALADLTFSGRFRLDSPEQSLELIGALFGLRLDRREGTIYLARG